MKRALLGLVLLASSARAEAVVGHTVEPRPSSYAGTFEMLVYPAVVQVNGALTQHAGAAIGFAWHPHENFGVQLSGFFNPLAKATASGFSSASTSRCGSKFATSSTVGRSAR